MKLKLLTLSCLCSLPITGWSAQNSLTLSSGAFYSEGQSSTTNSNNSTLIAVPLSLSGRYQKLRYGLSTAYLNSKYNGTTADGMGDTTVSLGYEVYDKPWVTLKGKYKFATGDANKGLSTGKDDLSFQVDLFQPVSRKSSLFATLGYKFVGKVSGQSMQNSLYASVGGGYLPLPGLSTGLTIDYRQATYTTLKDALGASLFISKKLSQNWSAAVFGGYDNTDTLSTGLTFSYKL